MMIFLKIFGGLLVVAGILIPLGQLQAVVNAAHAATSSTDAAAVLHQAGPGIMAWNLPANVASPILLLLGGSLMLWERKSKSAPAAAPPSSPRGSVTIRQATEGDWAAIWPIFHAVVSRGETYSYDPDTSREEGFRLWMTPPATAYLALKDDRVVGTYTLKPNQPGLGAHVANAGFMVAPEASGQGIGRALGLHALDEARRQGYAAMQFNCVIQTNTSALALWESLGFTTVGTVPQAFRHRTLGLTDVHVMHRFL